ncbi:TPA: glutamine ABC transporter substrate-binding protein GlnH [Raoultella ornithinolytica]|uniref:glutamine ABC transporter substrate-binding protein GlnH n=1 Tax=Raoultella ornithinolytica TaxID=54291 RepID=UPI001D8F8E74|nr:glutamine ABC transporter substrate-binding protein GlnH [Raoultella ornithinolytica]MEB6435845.1 glutamine ABC transporter substrate-binding protein GlnH [Raoultella ornithinolytica]HBH8229642.1 glutamine ABC transporter substrate-binding protein GlnH [Raoultella ornithinolytica]HDX8328659.1 glutamine ABC transporter substrate-binding protein GlnH [Raoultella ornithinolytica CD1_MRS_4]
MSTLLSKLKITLALVACSTSFLAAAQDKITVGVDTAFVPFEFKQGDKYVGFDIDLWDAIAKKMNISYELRPMDFGGLIPGLQSRNLDVAMAGITITDARKQVVDFSDGYYNADLLMAVKTGNNSITRFSDLAGKKVGLKQGTAAATFMKSKYKANYIEFPNIDNAYLDLQAGNLDAVVHDSPNVLYYVKTAGGGKVKSTGESDSILPQQYGFAMQKNSSLTPKINAALEALRVDGTYSKIYVKWFDKQPK